MNNDLISRSELKKAIDTYDRFACLITNHLVPVRQLLCPEQYESYVPYRDVIKCIDNAPTVEARPTGKWYYNYQNGWHCSICHETVKDMPTVMGKADFNFCPNCGAKMKGGEEE
jgi:hypothetical protein